MGRKNVDSGTVYSVECLHFDINIFGKPLATTNYKQLSDNRQY